MDEDEDEDDDDDEDVDDDEDDDVDVDEDEDDVDEDEDEDEDVDDDEDGDDARTGDDMRLDAMEPGHAVCVETPRPDGSSTTWLGKIGEVTPTEIGLTEVVWVAHTGRRSEFLAGKFGAACELEPWPAEAEVRLPRWGAVVGDWLHEIPREAR